MTTPAHRETACRIAVIPGDGIGLEVTREAVRVLEAASIRYGLRLAFTHFDLGADRWLERGVAMTDDEFASLAGEHDAILLGALGDPRVPGNEHAREILLGLRTRLDLYINYRPARVLHPALSPLKGDAAATIDLHIFRENTEGAYGGIGGRLAPGTENEVATQTSLHTRRGVERIIRAAFDFARREARERVTMVDKANAMPHAGRLWRDTFEVIRADYPEITGDHRYVDAMAMELVRRPEAYDVLVTDNLFGDILSDLAAQITGGLGAAASANLHPGRHALFEPVHGSAPDIAGTGAANPLGAIACAALVLEHAGSHAAADAVERAITMSLDAGPRTPDFGGDATTEEVGAWIADEVARGDSAPPHAEADR
ncbi:MAG: isocitrate/isopropylmalate dehydrogenase family protein [Longimicrobiales bacterium]|nr:isocitrate/isopropylmalate dehydrogenase family protein [Longimicrobiales bacterium]